MQLSISHTTRYQFDGPVRFGLQQLRKTPLTVSGQSVLDWATEVEGGLKELSYRDQHGNVVELISFQPETRELTLRSVGTVAVEDTNGIVGRHLGLAPLWMFERATPLTKAGQGVKALLRDIPDGGELERLHHLSAAILEAVKYDTASQDNDHTAEEVLTEGRGVCQDHAHVFLAAAREMGFPARYVSGYLLLDDRTEQDAMHAWVEAHVDGLGWVGFDISNGISPDTRYVRVATGLDYAEAAPVTGTRQGGIGETLAVEIAVSGQQQSQSQ